MVYSPQQRFLQVTSAALILGQMLILSGCGKPPVPPKMPPMPVIIESVEMSGVSNTTDYVATLLSRQSVILQPQVSGQISRIYVTPGQNVRQGQPLIQIDADQQRAAVNSALASARAIKSSISSANAQLTAAQAQRQSAASNLDVTQRQFNRANTLFADQSLSQQELERSNDALKRAQADLNATAAQINATRAGISTARGNYQQALAVANQQKVLLRYYTITAPFSGQVGDIPVRLGGYVSPQTLLTSVTQNNNLEINVSVPSASISKLAMGKQISLYTPENEPLGAARISFISPRVDETNQTILVKAIVDNANGRLKANQILNARLLESTSSNILIPPSAVVSLVGNQFVYKVIPGKDKEGFIARQVPVKLANLYNNRYRVLSGLQPGDKIVTQGVQKLRDGAEISPQVAGSNPGAAGTMPPGGV